MKARTTVRRELLDGAQKELRLSNESVARQIPVSEKTWRRWKNAGEIPNYALPLVAEILQLELESQRQEDLRVQPVQAEAILLLQSVARTDTELLEGQREMLARIADLERDVRVLLERIPGRAARPGLRKL